MFLLLFLFSRFYLLFFQFLIIFFKFIEYLFEYISTQEKENDCRMTYTM